MVFKKWVCKNNVFGCIRIFNLLQGFNDCPNFSSKYGSNPWTICINRNVITVPVSYFHEKLLVYWCISSIFFQMHQIQHNLPRFDTPRWWDEIWRGFQNVRKLNVEAVKNLPPPHPRFLRQWLYIYIYQWRRKMPKSGGTHRHVIYLPSVKN